MSIAQMTIMSAPLRDNTQDSACKDTDEQALVKRIALGDRKAFEELFTQHGERIFRYAFRLINDSSKAEEVTNDVMLEVWKSAAKFEGRSKVSTWLLGIARNLAFNAVRRKQLDTTDIDEVPEAPAPEQDSGAQAHDGTKLKESMHVALKELSAEHRDVVELTFFHGCSYQEIAQIVGCPENTVKTRMYHAKKQLQGLLLAAGIDVANVEMAS